MSGGSKTQTQKQTQTQSLPAWQDAAIQNMAGQAQSAYAATPKTAFGGELYAGPNQTQQGALDQRLSLANRYAGAGQGVQGLANRTIAGDFLMPDSNPALQAGIDAAINPLQQNLMRNILPAVRSRAIANGTYGGSANGVTNSLALNDFNTAALNTAGSMQLQNYQQERQNQINAPQMLAQAFGLDSLAPEMQFGVGSQRQEWQQNEDNAALQRYNMQVAAPWQGMDQLRSVLQGNYGGTTEGTTEQTQKSKMGFGDFAQMALGVGLAAAGFPMAGGGSLGGNLLSGLLGGGGGGGLAHGNVR